MLSPRLSGCLKCASITDLLADIDCKLDQLSISLYNNVVFSLNNSINATAINSLLIYKRILTYKLANDQYACNFSINAIASKVKLLVGGMTNCCAKRKKLKLSSTTSSTTRNPGLRVNVKDYGAIGDGKTNDTLAIQTAINENFAIYIPAGIYIIDTLTLNSNTDISGDGTTKTYLVRTNSYNPSLYLYRDALIYVDSHSETDHVNNLKISNLCLDGKVDEYGFSEQTHLMWLVGVSNVNLDNIKFLGYRGDGLYFGGVGYGPSYLDFTPRHNINANVVNCIFDGVNNNNRNGVSVIDGTNITINGCSFINSTRTDMPGAIDFEPDYNYNIIQNNTVKNCTFENINSAIFAISTVLWASPYTIFPSGFIFENNTVKNCSTAHMLYYIYQINPPDNTLFITQNEGVCNIIFRNNTCSNSFRPFYLYNANGIIFENNTFTDFNDVAYVSFPLREYVTCRNIEIKTSTFERCGKGTTSKPGLPYFTDPSPNGTAIRIYNINTLVISGNHFIDCGNGTTPASAIEFFEGNYYYYTNQPNSSYNININNNIFSTPTGKTKYAINTGARWPGYSYVFNPSTNQFYGNSLNRLPYIFPTS